VAKGDAFCSLMRRDIDLYRGGNGDVSRAIIWAGVGPAREVAELIRDQTHDRIDTSMHRGVLRFFTNMFCGRGVTVALPYDTLADNLDMLLPRARTAPNLYTSFEHVVWEAPINTPYTGKSLESVTKHPQVSILYAYGLSADAWFDNSQIAYYRDEPNSSAFIAVLQPADDPPLAAIHATNVYGGNGLDEDEAQRRVARDHEVLLQDAQVPAVIVDLPSFDTNDPLGSLDRAAEQLRTRGVAV